MTTTKEEYVEYIHEKVLKSGFCYMEIAKTCTALDEALEVLQKAPYEYRVCREWFANDISYTCNRCGGLSQSEDLCDLCSYHDLEEDLSCQLCGGSGSCECFRLTITQI